MKKIYEGKSKDLYLADNQQNIICYYKDNVTANNGGKKDVLNNKGMLNNKITEIVFKFLEKNNISTHFISRISDNEQLVKKTSVIPLEIIIRNIASGSFCRNYDVKEGIKFESPIFEMSYKNDDLHDPLINKDHSIALKIVNESEYKYIKNQALLINSLLQKFFKNINIILVDFKLEFGKLPNNTIILIDEFSPDNCRLWDSKTNKKLDKDVYRNDTGNLMDGYKEVYKRLKEKYEES